MNKAKEELHSIVRLAFKREVQLVVHPAIDKMSDEDAQSCLDSFNDVREKLSLEGDVLEILIKGTKTTQEKLSETVATVAEETLSAVEGGVNNLLSRLKARNKKTAPKDKQD